jgi:hypothetical protein
VVKKHIEEIAIHIRPDIYFELIDPQSPASDLADEYHEIMGRRGI